jgi:hypothetical protein
VEDIKAATKFFNDTIQCPGSNAMPELKNKEDSVENGTTYEHPQARDYLTQRHRSTKYSSMITKMEASKHF